MAILQEPLKSAIKRLRAQRTDDADYEAKACGHGLSASVWDTVSSFANTTGGILLLGVDELNGFTVTNGFDINKTRDQFVEGIGDGGSSGIRLSNPPTYRMRREELDGHQILVVTIFINDIGRKPCYVTAKGIENGSYKRIDDKDIRLSAAEIYEFRHQLTPSQADIEIVADADIPDLDDQTLRLIFASKKDSRALYGAKTKLQKLSRLDITNKKNQVLLGGLLVAGQYPQQFFPRLIIDVTAHPSNAKAESRTLRFLDRKQCDGPIPVMLGDALEAIKRNLRIFSVIEGIGRRDELEIPEEVLREALANAVVHREYHEYFRGQAISVDIYPNRIEITNPGGLWGGTTKENLANGYSRCRNATLISLVRDTPIPGKNGGTTVEGQGSGIPFMIRQMEQQGLAAPSFKPSVDQFTVILWRKSSYEINGNGTKHKYQGEQTTTIADKPGLFVDYKQHSTDQPATTSGIGGTAGIVLDAMPVDAPITTRQLAQRTGKSPKTVQRALNALIDDGSIKATGKPRSRARAYSKV